MMAPDENTAKATDPLARPEEEIEKSASKVELRV